MNNNESTSDAIRATQARENVANLNSDALMRLCSVFGLTLPRNAKDWRPTQRTRGFLPGFEREFEVLCTDGCVAWYIDAADVLFYGHVQHFTGDIKPLHSVSSAGPQGTKGPKKPKGPKTPKLTLELALAALKAHSAT